MARNKKKIGIALSGGAARALSHIGALKVLEELDFEIEAISGTSMGAIIGAFYCAGISLKTIEDYVNSMDWRSFLMFSDITLPRMGIINGRRVEQVLDDFLGEKEFSQCSKKFCCVAVDLISQDRVVLSSGKLKKAVRASISIPGFFSPVFYDDKILVDGGVIEPFPSKAIRMFDLDGVIGVSISFKRGKDLRGYYKNIANPNKRNAADRLRSFFSKGKGKKQITTYEILNTSFNIIQREMSRQYHKYADVVIQPEVGNFGFFDFTSGKEIIKKGVIAAENKLPDIEKLLK